MTEAGDDEYNDLDELVARYAEPYMRSVEAVTKHRRAPAPAPVPIRRRWMCRLSCGLRGGRPPCATLAGLVSVMH